MASAFSSEDVTVLRPGTAVTFSHWRAGCGGDNATQFSVPPSLSPNAARASFVTGVVNQPELA